MTDGKFVEIVPPSLFDQVVPELANSKISSSTMQSEVETYLDRNIWSTLTNNISNGDYAGKDILHDSRDIINFVDTSILIDTREGIHGEMGVVTAGHHHHLHGVIKDEQMSYHHPHHSSDAHQHVWSVEERGSQHQCGRSDCQVCIC